MNLLLKEKKYFSFDKQNKKMFNQKVEDLAKLTNQADRLGFDPRFEILGSALRMGLITGGLFTLLFGYLAYSDSESITKAIPQIATSVAAGGVFGAVFSGISYVFLYSPCSEMWDEIEYIDDIRGKIR